jgi:hypothetical protein
MASMGFMVIAVIICDFGYYGYDGYYGYRSYRG